MLLQELCAKAAAHCASRGVELGKLSVHYNLSNQKAPIATTLLGVGNMTILKLNLETVTGGLTKLEQEVLEEILETYFKNVSLPWEGNELAEYNKAVSS